MINTEDKKMLELIEKLEKEIEISNEDFEKLSKWYSKAVKKLKDEVQIIKTSNSKK